MYMQFLVFNFKSFFIFFFGYFGTLEIFTLSQVEFAQKNVIINGKVIQLAIWDTCGTEQYKALTKKDYQGAAGALFIFDITDRSSFKSLEKWLKVKNQNASSIVVMLVANKIALQEQRKVSKQEAAQFAFEHNLAYLETRAKDENNIKQEIEQLATSTLIRNHKIIAIN